MPLKPSILTHFNDLIAKHYANDTGKMLIHTGVIGWILSAAAQVMAIYINDKIPKKQKMYLIPQELADAAVNIISFYAITQSCKSLASKLVKTGKWLPKSIRGILDSKGLADRVGKLDFNVYKDAGLSPSSIKRLTHFNNGIDVVATTAGSIASCNLVTPVVRNYIAANRQKSLIARFDSKDEKHASYVESKNYGYFAKPSIYDFSTHGNLKI